MRTGKEVSDVNANPKSKRLRVEVTGYFNDDGYRMMLRLLKDYGTVQQASFDASRIPSALATFVISTVHDAKTITDLLAQVSRNSEVNVEASHA